VVAITLGAQSLDEQQLRPLNVVELQRFAADWRHVLSRMADRRAPADEVAAVEARPAADVAICWRSAGNPMARTASVAT